MPFGSGRRHKMNLYLLILLITCTGLIVIAFPADCIIVFGTFNILIKPLKLLAIAPGDFS